MRGRKIMRTLVTLLPCAFASTHEKAHPAHGKHRQLRGVVLSTGDVSHEQDEPLKSARGTTWSCMIKHK